METWKDIFEGYQVSDLGRVKSFKKGKELILKQQKDHKGYLTVSIYINNQKKTKRVHKLVAIAFIPNPHKLPEVNHLDTNKENNCVSNLEWCTTKENIQHSIRNGLRKASDKQRQQAREHGRKQGKLNSKKTLQYDLQGNLIKEWESATEATNQLNINNITACCKGRLKTAGGFIWKYKDAQ